MIGTTVAVVAGFCGGVAAGPDDDAAASMEAGCGFVATTAWLLEELDVSTGAGSSGPNRPQPASASTSSVKTKALPSLPSKG